MENKEIAIVIDGKKYEYLKSKHDGATMTCVEDCTQEKRREWCLTKTQDYLREVIKTEADTFKDLCNYLVDEKCVTDEQRTEFFAMIDRAVERSKYNWAVHELADQVDFVCSKVVLLADACGVTKHVED